MYLHSSDLIDCIIMQNLASKSYAHARIAGCDAGMQLSTELHYNYVYYMHAWHSVLFPSLELWEQLSKTDTEWIGTKSWRPAP